MGCDSFVNGCLISLSDVRKNAYLLAPCIGLIFKLARIKKVKIAKISTDDYFLQGGIL